MDLKEFAQVWRKYALDDGKSVKALNDYFVYCLGPAADEGLLFAPCGESRNSIRVLKVDENNILYCRKPGNGWERLGRLGKIGEPLPRQRRITKSTIAIIAFVILAFLISLAMELIPILLTKYTP